MLRGGFGVLNDVYDICGRAFVGCPRDAEPFYRMLDGVWMDLPVSGLRPELVHWKKDYDATADRAALPDQFKIARTSDPDTDPVFILFSHSIGTPVRPPPGASGAEEWRVLRQWLNTNGWPFVALVGDEDFQDPNNPPAGKIPLSGTMFELFDVLRTGRESRLILYDLSGIRLAMPPQPLPNIHQQNWCKWLLEELHKSYSPRAPRAEEDFKAQVREDLQKAFDLSDLDPFEGELPSLEAIDRQPQLFGRDELIRRMNRRVFEEGASCIPVLGVSGAGKSSFLRSGLMRGWFRESPRGPGLLFGARAFLFEPELLVLHGADPLDALGRMLLGGPEAASGERLISLGERLTVSPPTLPLPTGDFVADLRQIATWWQQLTRELPAHQPIILICDQAEQIDARARQEAEKHGGERIEPRLDPTWQRFTAFLGWLGGLLSDNAAPEPSVPAQVILGLHRMSALGLWPIAQERVLRSFEVSPIAQAEELRAIIHSTCGTYGLRLEPTLLDAMVEEASTLATANLRIRVEAGTSDPDAKPTQASVLPQVRTALGIMITEWRRRHDYKRDRPEGLTDRERTLDLETYEAFRSIEGAIEHLGEQAWAGWQQALARERGIDARGFIESRLLEQESRDGFGDLMSGLVDARGDGRQDLTLLPLDDPRATRQDSLVKELRRQRLLTTTEVVRRGRPERTNRLRLPHRTILEHWARARLWVDSARLQLETKDRLRGLFERVIPATDWPADFLESLADLAVNWIGTGEDTGLLDYLHTGLVTRLDPENVDVRSDSSLQTLPFAAMRRAHAELAMRLLKSCINHPSWPQKVGSYLLACTQYASTELAETILKAPQTPPEIANWSDPTTGLFPLLLPSQEGNEAMVSLLLDAKANPNMENRSGAFPLLVAAENGREAVVSLLLDAGATLSKVNPTDGSFALLQAAQQGHAAIVLHLLNRGALPNQASTRLGTFPLLLAALKGHASAVNHLLKFRADPNKRNPRTDHFPLLLAAHGGHDAVVGSLLDAKADPNMVHISGAFPLLLAVQDGNPMHDDRLSVVDHLLKAGAVANAVNDADGTFPLLQAAMVGRATVVDRLLKANASPNQINHQNGDFPILLAAQNGHAAVVDRLLGAEADPNQTHKKSGAFALLLAAHDNHIAVVDRLLEAHADVNKVANDGSFPLLQAAEQGHAEVVERLLRANAVADKIAPRGVFPLLFAAERGYDSVVSHLLAANADPNATNLEDHTFPLLMAAVEGHATVVDILLNAGADPNKMHSGTGLFPLLVAAQYGRETVVARLLEANVSPDTVHKETGDFPLLLAADGGHYGVVRHLLEAKANPNKVNDTNGFFPLLVAAVNGSEAITRALLAFNADPKKVNSKSGDSALLLAARNGREQVVEQLIAAKVELDSVNDENGMFALLLAVMGRHQGVIAKLLDAKVDPDKVNPNYDMFSLLSATLSGDDAIVAQLLGANANANKVAHQSGYFPLLASAQVGNEAVTSLLLNAGADPHKAHAVTGITPLIAALFCGHADISRVLALATGEFDKSLEQAVSRLQKMQTTEEEPVQGTPSLSSSAPSASQGLPLPAAWILVDSGEARQTLGAGVIESLKMAEMPVEHFRGMLRMDLYPLSPDKGLSLIRAQFAIGPRQLIAVETTYFIGAALPPIVVLPGLDIDAVMRTFAAEEVLPDFRLPEFQKLLAAIFLLTRPSPIMPLLENNTLPVQQDGSALTVDFTDSAWRLWHCRSGADGTYVELPWIDGKKLVRGRVLIPADGIGIRILDVTRSLGDRIAYAPPLFMSDEKGRPSGLWRLGELQ